ncbi:MAG: glycosyltransferase, partial [Pirellulales bacterium]
MRVLIADFDLFRTVGGGQTFYRAIIEKNPHIEFSYLTVSEAQDAARPANARPIVYQHEYHDQHWAPNCDILPPRWCLPAFLLASNIAWTVRGQRFDVVDVPDYHPFGYFLPAALEHHSADVGRVALSMHGLISTTVSFNWASEGVRLGALIVEENMQYQCVDLRYGLSTMYLDEWRARSALPSHYLSPLRFLDPPRPARSSPGGAPALNFIGRTEKRKGPDLFTDLVWWLPPESYGQARIIGPPVLDLNGVSSDHYLRALLYHRPGAKQVELCPSATPDELAAVFAGRSVTVVPSRYDTFNLVALESLFAGCPTAIGSGAGVCRFLDETFPEAPYVKIEMQSPLAALSRLAEVLHDYDRHRERLVRALTKAKPAVQGSSLADIYASPAAFDRDVRREASAWYERLMQCRFQPETRRRTAQEAHKLAAACKTTARKKLLARAPIQRRLDRR